MVKAKPAKPTAGGSRGAAKGARASVSERLAFRDKLLLNQWLIGLFGVNPLEADDVRPFRRLSEPIRDPRLEGLDSDNLHRFFHHLASSPLFIGAESAAPGTRVTRAMLLAYEENIVRHTQAINARRTRPVVWKYFQWLSLLFVEVYLDRFFGNRARLLADLNTFVERFNTHWKEKGYEPAPPFAADDLNKLCLQNATGSGKTLLMHVNVLQYRHYAALNGRESEMSRTILLTPNESLSAQHVAEFHGSGIAAQDFMASRGDLLGAAAGLARVDVLEITKLADQSGPNTIATRDLGDQNLLLVDEGHRGMSGKEEGVWFARRSALCERGFTFEYSATFEQAVRASGNAEFEHAYSRAVIFDYSYRWFYEDGFGKDYQIINLPTSFDTVRRSYMTACLLKFYQQLRIYQERWKDFDGFYIEKPLWVFVGSTVSSAKLSRDEALVATDVAQIIGFIAGFLDSAHTAIQDIGAVLTGGGQATGLLDSDSNDIFADAFPYLNERLSNGETARSLYGDILTRVFNHAAGGHLSLLRVSGESGEIALRAGMAEQPFGLINVGDAKGLCDHVAALAAQNGANLTVDDSDFTEERFASVKESSSPVNLLIGSKKFVEGWDCWRVSTMGLMHVGRSEGAQIIQLFGRGVRLKGHSWGLKRSSHVRGIVRPKHIGELETLNVFGIEANFMEKFRQFLSDEGLPGMERPHEETIPLAVTHDFGKKLKIVRPKRKSADGEEYDFLRDGPSLTLDANIPDALLRNRVEVDWFPRIQTLASRQADNSVKKEAVSLDGLRVALLDVDRLYFDLEAFKQERGWFNLNIPRSGIRDLLARNDWYTLYLPEVLKLPSDYSGVRQLQQVAAELLKRYVERLYHHAQRAYVEPRLEVRELTPDDENLPQEDAYRIIVDASEKTLIAAIREIKNELAAGTNALSITGVLRYSRFGNHLYEPLLYAANSKIAVQPVALNQSEFQFVRDLQDWCARESERLVEEGVEIFLLRNLSRGKGVGFFEASNFHPDFILWTLKDGKQYVSFIEPHGLRHEQPGSDKVRFCQTVKEIEARLHETSPENDDLVLNSFILSPTPYAQLQWEKSKDDLEKQHILFMQDDAASYIGNMFEML